MNLDISAHELLSVRDLQLLHEPFAREVEHLLPFPAMVVFFGFSEATVLHPLFIAPDGAEVLLRKDVDGKDFGMVGERLFFRLPLPSGETVIVVISEVDPGLLQRVSNDWLVTFRPKLLQEMHRVLQVYTDPETGLYHQRALSVALEEMGVQSDGCFFIISTVFYKRAAAGTIQKNNRTAALLRAVTTGTLFSFGFGVFGLLQDAPKREQALNLAHFLQRQLKREGLYKVQIGFSKIQESKDVGREKFTETVWQALAKAEQRGPFGICDAEVLRDDGCHPFRLPSAHILSKLRYQWRGIRSFTMIIVAIDTMQDGGRGLKSVLLSACEREKVVVEVCSSYLYCLLPEVSAAAVSRCLAVLEDQRQSQAGRTAVRAGIAKWPFLDFSKTDVVRNCMKALRHCSFYEQGGIVEFEPLTLNVSGDFYFDEGDFRAAVRDYKRGLMLDPEDVNLLNSLGVALVECNQPRKAAECFLHALQEDPGNYMALVNLGNVHMAANRQKEALQYFLEARTVADQTRQDCSELYLPLGKLYCELGLYDEAVGILEEWQTCKGSAQEFILFRLQGKAYLGDDKPVKAITACQRALQLYPQDSISLSILGLLYVEQGQGSDVGLALCNKALAIDKFNPDHWFRLGRALYEIENLDGALQAAKECIRLQRRHIDGVLLLGQLYKTMGKERLALTRFRQVLKIRGCTDKQAAAAGEYLKSKASFAG